MSPSNRAKWHKSRMVMDEEGWTTVVKGDQATSEAFAPENRTAAQSPDPISASKLHLADQYLMQRDQVFWAAEMDRTSGAQQTASPTLQADTARANITPSRPRMGTYKLSHRERIKAGPVEKAYAAASHAVAGCFPENSIAVDPQSLQKEQITEVSENAKLIEPGVTDPVIEQPVINLMDKVPLQEREKRLLGPRITIWIGKKAIKDIPKRAAMAASTVLNVYFAKYPSSLAYHLPSHHLCPSAVHTLLVDYLTWVCEVPTMELRHVDEQPTFKQNIALLHASYLLGMARYTDLILVKYATYMRGNLNGFEDCFPSYEEMRIVEAHTFLRRDLVYTRMVNRLGWARLNDRIPDPDVLDAFLDDHPFLKKAVAKAEAFFSTRQRLARGRGHHGRLGQSQRQGH